MSGKPWRMTAARRTAIARNFKIYLLRGIIGQSQVFAFRYVERAAKLELKLLGAKR